MTFQIASILAVDGVSAGSIYVLIAVGLVLVNNAFLNVAGWFYQFVPTPNL